MTQREFKRWLPNWPKFLSAISIMMWAVLISGCNISFDEPPPTATITPQPTATATNVPPARPTPTPSSRFEWQPIAQGLEQRNYEPPNGRELYALRVDPAFYTFRAHANLETPLRIQQWEEQLADAEIILNANFYSETFSILGLLISDGQQFGSPYQRGGTFMVEDGEAKVVRNPIVVNDRITQAVQAFPLLIENGRQAYTNPNDTFPARRTFIGEDESGRIIIMIATGFGIGLHELSEYLPTTDIGFVTATNLDGGGSTMLYVRPIDYRVISFDPVPAVLAVYRRE